MSVVVLVEKSATKTKSRQDAGIPTKLTDALLDASVVDVIKS
jgi:hypothetical protein